MNRLKKSTVIPLYNDILFIDFFQLVIELCLNKPFSVENNKNAFNIPNPAYIKGAQHLLEPTYFFFYFSLLTLSLGGRNHLMQSLFFTNMLKISCNLLSTVLKVENRIVV